MSQMGALVQVFRKLVVYFRRSPKATYRLDKIQRETQGKAISIIVDCPTRCNSCRDMLARLVDLSVAMDHFFSYLSQPNGKANLKMSV